MIQLKDTQAQSTAHFLERAIRTAEYYGFIPLETALARGKRALPQTAKGELQFARKDERALLQSARSLLTVERRDRDVPLVWRLVNYEAGVRSQFPCVTLELHVLGAPTAIAEALLIVVANAIAEEAGIAKRMLAINSIGSLESSNRFVRDVGGFLRKHLDSIAPVLRPRAAQDPLGTLIQLFEKGHPAVSRAPQSVDYLSEEERRRFWDLLEYLEISGVPYELNASILGSRDLWSQTLFELASIDAETGVRTPFVVGGRYDPLASRLLGNPASAVMATIVAEIKGRNRVPQMKRVSPTLYFAHLGSEARRRALPVLETLRRAGIPVQQSLMHDRLHEQMEYARSTHVPYLLIMGHKEAMEGTVLVREVATNSQEAIPVPDLTSYLRRQRALAL